MKTSIRRTNRKNTNSYHYSEQEIGKTHLYYSSILFKVPTTQLASMNVDLKFVELTADVLEMFL